MPRRRLPETEHPVSHPSAPAISLSSTLCLVRLAWQAYRPRAHRLSLGNSFASWVWERDIVKLIYHGKEEITAWR